MSRLTRWIRSHRRRSPESLEHLLYVPSLQRRTEQLAGQDFRIVDGPTTYASYREIFEDEIYRFEATTPAPRIVDCGANCGVSVVYFKTLYPQAKIIAVEADPQIYEVLAWNVAERGLTDVTLINKAVATGGGNVTFYCQGADAGRIHRMDYVAGQCSVPAVDLDELLQEPVDLLKIDIEGAETDVICSCGRLDAVSHLFLEYHSFVDSEQTLHEVLQKLSASGFRYYLQTQFCADRPLVEDDCHLGMDLQVNVFAKRIGLARSGLNANGATANGQLPASTPTT